MDIIEYHRTLCPQRPVFLEKYLSLPLLKRLDGVGLLCGTDWTPLYHNQFFYSRLDHSIGTALILWNFTHDKAVTIAGLLHDVSTPAFSHVGDFRRGDVLQQEATEDGNRQLVDTDAALNMLLLNDGLDARAVDDYHRYPLADNELPGLCADRLEYMFPSGMILNGSWDMESFKKAYADIIVCMNEAGQPELGFADVQTAEDYCRRCCDVGLVLQHNENKLALSLMGKILDSALACRIIKEADVYKKSEEELISLFDHAAEHPRNGDELTFAAYVRTFRTMDHILHTDTQQPDCFCVSLDVKKRYIDPLVADTPAAPAAKDGTLPAGRRVSTVSDTARHTVQHFLSYKDTAWGCVPLAKP